MFSLMYCLLVMDFGYVFCLIFWLRIGMRFGKSCCWNIDEIEGLWFVFDDKRRELVDILNMRWIWLFIDIICGGLIVVYGYGCLYVFWFVFYELGICLKDVLVFFEFFWLLNYLNMDWCICCIGVWVVEDFKYFMLFLFMC